MQATGLWGIPLELARDELSANNLDRNRSRCRRRVETAAAAAEEIQGRLRTLVQLARFPAGEPANAGE